MIQLVRLATKDMKQLRFTKNKIIGMWEVQLLMNVLMNDQNFEGATKKNYKSSSKTGPGNDGVEAGAFGCFQ